MIYLTVEDLVRIAHRVVDGDVVVSDIGLLGSAAARPRASAFGEDAYPTLETKAAALVQSVALNHALVDGNERLALGSLIAFLGVNGRRLTLTNDEAYDFVIDVVTHRLDDVEAIAAVVQGGTTDCQPTR